MKVSKHGAGYYTATLNTTAGLTQYSLMKYRSGCWTVCRTFGFGPCFSTHFKQKKDAIAAIQATTQRAPTPSTRTLRAAGDAIQDRELRNAVDYIIGSGEANANATVYDEKAAPEADWERIALGSIGVLLSAEGDRRTIAWFAEHGVTF